jgi:hypothetical protein
VKNNIASAVIAATTLTQAQFAAGATTSFFYKAGSAGSYIAQGSAGYISNGQGGWVLSTPLDQPYDSSIFIRMVEGNYNQYWFIHLDGPAGQTLTAGVYQANRWPFQSASKAGFDCASSGRGLNMSTTYLEIIDFQQDPITKIVKTLVFNALQFEEVESNTSLNLDTNRYAFLSYSFGSDAKINVSPSAALLAMTVPEPSGWLLAGLGACLIIKRRR